MRKRMTQRRKDQLRPLSAFVASLACVMSRTPIFLCTSFRRKSSFINWYIDESLQRTGVAMETNKITLVTSGKKQETLGVGLSVFQPYRF